MRVAFDASIQRDPPTGVERAQADALLALLAHADLTLCVLADRPLPERLRARLAGADPARLIVRCGSGRAPARLWRQTLLPRWVADLRADLLHVPVAAFPLALHGPLVATLHELPWMERAPGGDRRLAHRAWTRLALRRARRIVVPSGRTRAQVARLDPRAAATTRVVPWCVDPAWLDAAPPAHAAHSASPAGEPYLLAVGTLRRKKRLEGLVDAFADLRADGERLRLVLVGEDGDAAAALRARVAARGLTGAVDFAGRVDDARLAALYRGALALVHPSRLEGFGLPPLEAMASGCPVVATRQGAVDEVVGGGAARLVDGERPGALVAALREILHDGRARARLLAAGRARAAALSPQRLARALAAVYEECLRAPDAARAGVRSRSAR